MTIHFNLEGAMGAVLTDDRRHRLWLWRVWDRSRPVLVTCMFNPSTANERDDDQTIIRLCAFARRWGYGGVLVVNLHSYRTPDPSVLASVRKRGEPTRCEAQQSAWVTAFELAREQATPVLCAWGGLASDDDVAAIRVYLGGQQLVCLGTTKDGAPKHPMARGKHRIARDQKPILWRAAR